MALLIRCVALVVATLIVQVTSAAAQERASPGRGQKCSAGQRRALKDDVPADYPGPVYRDPLNDELTSLLAGRDLGSGYMVFHVEQTSGRRNVELIDLDIPKTLLDSLSVTLAKRVNQSGESVVIRFPVRPSLAPTDSVGGRFQECWPQLKNQSTISRFLGQQARNVASGPRFLDKRLETVVWIFVSHRGWPLATRIKRSSGSPSYDRLVVAAAMKMEFYPALIDSVLTPVWVDLPVRFVMPADTTIPRAP
jgi:TonB family protein